MLLPLHRTPKCITLALLATCSMITVLFLLSSYDGYYQNFSLSKLKSLNYFFSSDNDVNRRCNLDFESATLVDSAIAKNFPADLIGVLRFFTTQACSPLFLLDKILLECFNNSNFCYRLKTSKRFLFGAFGENLSRLNRAISYMQNSNWTVFTRSKQYYVLEKDKLEIVIVLIEKRSHYWLVGSVPDFNISTFAFLPSNPIETLAVVKDAQILTVNPIDRMITMLNRSKFLSCNETIAKNLRTKYKEYYSKPPLINDSALDDLAYLRDLLLKIGITPILFGGSLLGWYRECGIIPYTTDLDFAALAMEYNEKLHPALQRDKRLKLYWRLGKPDDSLEYSVYSGPTKIDLFFVYQSKNTNDSWAGGMIVGSRTKLRWYYPKLTDLCSADLKGHLFNVPCNVEGFLKADYGPGWYEPHHDSKFVWYQSHKNIQRAGTWKASEWSEVYRVYNYEG